MKRFYSQFRVMILMFALGLASVSFFNWLNDYLTEIPVDLPKVESSSPIFVFPRYDMEIPRGGSGPCGDMREAHKKRRSKSIKPLSNENVRNKN